MPRRKVTVFRITPQPAVRINQGDSIFFRIPEDQLREEGLKRKLRLQKYNEYKNDLRLIAEFLKYSLEPAGTHIEFYLPVSKSWRPGKKAAHHDKPHQNKPDVDNLLKAFMDALKPADQVIWDVRITKRWTNSEDGRIEISTIAIR